MLQQILSSMHIDPDLLANLSEDDRQKLFHKMRVEQVRRWEAWEEKNLQEEKNRTKPKLPPKPGKKKVQFMLGDDGNPLVWVIDEAKYISVDDDKESSGFSMDNCSVNSIVERFNGLTIKSPSLKRRNSNISRVTRDDTVSNENGVEDKEVQTRLTKARISTQTHDSKDEGEKADWLKKLQHKLKTKDTSLTNEPKSEPSVDAMPEVTRVYALLQNTQKNATELQNSIKRSIESESLKDIADPETVKQISEIARKAREEIEEINSHSAVVSRNKRNLSPIDSQGRSRHDKPKSKEAILEWYSAEERPRGAGINAKTHEQELWFHGMITRQEAENLLSNQAVGTFLVRLSDKLFGYAISYRAEDKCKHYLIDATNGYYHLVGESSKNFFKLADMIRYYEVQSITPAGRDFLLKPCPVITLHKKF